MAAVKNILNMGFKKTHTYREGSRFSIVCNSCIFGFTNIGLVIHGHPIYRVPQTVRSTQLVFLYQLIFE